jgi:hypothetical protein
MRVFELHALPERILTDNGSPFVAPSSRFGLTRLSAWWRMHGDMAMELAVEGSRLPRPRARGSSRSLPVRPGGQIDYAANIWGNVSLSSVP